MNNKKGFLQWFKQTFFGMKDEESAKKPSKYQFMIVIVVLGISFMLISNFFSSSESSQLALPAVSEANENKEVFGSKGDEKSATIKEYETQYENQLKDALETIVGVGDVMVLVNVDASALKVLEKNITSQSQTTNETDREGGKRKVEDQSRTEEVVIIGEGEQKKPIILTTKKPPIRGVLVVAKGAENIQVKQWIVEAVTRLLDVPSHRVSVLPKKSKGE